MLERIDNRCRTTWFYQIPTGATEQTELRSILIDTLRFENHFLDRYRNFLFTQFTNVDRAAQQAALRLLQNTPYADAAIHSVNEEC